MKMFKAIIFLLCLSVCSCSNTTNEKRFPVPTPKESPKKQESVQALSTAKLADNKVESDIPKEQLEKAKELISNFSEEEIDAIDAKAKFKTFCGICHGIKGDMSINGSKKLTKTKTSLTERVAQVYFGKSTMTPFKGVLKDVEIVAVSKYIDELR